MKVTEKELQNIIYNLYGLYPDDGETRWIYPKNQYEN